MNTLITSPPSKSPIKTILLSGLVAGTLDMTAAILVYSTIQNKVTPIRLMQSIASGLFGKEAYAGGNMMALYGLLLHYVIAFSFAIAYFFVFPFVPFLLKHKVIAGLLYGAFTWLVMNFIVLPIAFKRVAPMTPSSVIIGASLIIFLVGLPISLITHKYYTRTIR